MLISYNLLTLQSLRSNVKKNSLKLNIMDIPIQELFDGEDEEDDGFDHPSIDEELFVDYEDVPVEEF